MEKSKEKKKRNHFSKLSHKRISEGNPFLKYTGLGFQMIATILLGVWLGTVLDAHFELTNPVFTASLSLFSVIAAIYLGIKELIR